MIGLLSFKKKNVWVYVIIAFLVYFVWIFCQTNADYEVLVNQEKEITAKIEEEKEKNASLKAVEKSVNSQETIESMARSDLNYLKENETMFIDGEKAGR